MSKSKELLRKAGEKSLEGGECATREKPDFQEAYAYCQSACNDYEQAYTELLKEVKKMEVSDMVLTKEQIKDLEKASKPLMKFLSEFHPHVKVIVDSVCAEFVEGSATFRTEEFIKN